MRSEQTEDVTSLLRVWEMGDRSVEQRLWPIVFAELKRLARRNMAHERTDHTLQSDALINEVYLKLADPQGRHWANRAHFFAVCARMMRQVLVDHARARQTHKRGGHEVRVALDGIAILVESRGPQLLVLDDAMKR